MIRRRAGSRDARREGLLAVADWRGADKDRRNRVERDELHERFRERPAEDRNRESQRRARNSVSEMRFPAPREARGNARALSRCRGGRSQQSLAIQRGATAGRRSAAETMSESDERLGRSSAKILWTQAADRAAGFSRLQ